MSGHTPATFGKATRGVSAALTNVASLCRHYGLRGVRSAWLAALGSQTGAALHIATVPHRFRNRRRASLDPTWRRLGGPTPMFRLPIHSRRDRCGLNGGSKTSSSKSRSAEGRKAQGSPLLRRVEPECWLQARGVRIVQAPCRTCHPHEGFSNCRSPNSSPITVTVILAETPNSNHRGGCSGSSALGTSLQRRHFEVPGLCWSSIWSSNVAWRTWGCSRS
mmetsp:Transcript_96425/g.210864  ORF Transcript_96425/g.210864 Transcript_96425/m.210864 type:complete len:220 (+) Transcript_96425:127-786(+)